MIEAELPLLEDVRRSLASESADFDGRRRRRERIEHVLELAEDSGGEDWADAVLRRKRALWRQGSYAQLGACLLQLRLISGESFVAFMVAFGPPSADRVVGPKLMVRSEAAMGWVLGEMPEEIRVPQHLIAPLSLEADIVELTRRRLSQSAIAKMLGTTLATVAKVQRQAVTA